MTEPYISPQLEVVTVPSHIDDRETEQRRGPTGTCQIRKVRLAAESETDC